MAELTRRLQVVLDEPRWVRLERPAQRRGTSVDGLEEVERVDPVHAAAELG